MSLLMTVSLSESGSFLRFSLPMPNLLISTLTTNKLASHHLSEKEFKKILGLLKVLKLRFSVASQVNGGSDVEARLSGQNYLHLSNMAPQFCLFLPGVCRLLKSAD